MYWLLPRSHPGARTVHERAGVRFSTTDGGPLPHGATARLLMVWMHLEVQRTAGQELDRGRSLEAFARSLGLDAAAWAAQTERLCACTLSHEDWTCPIATPAPGPALRLGAPLYEALRRHPFDVSERCLRALRSAPALLDHYLRKCYTEEYYRVDLDTPSVREMLRLGPEAGTLYKVGSELWRIRVPGPATPWTGLYQELAERPAPAPTEAELRAFRDRASADALAVFVVETSCGGQDTLAQSPPTLALH